MIRSIRSRLQWWYGAVYALSIIVFGCLVYWRADRDMHERASQQVVSTAQYLDVSLRSARPIHAAGPDAVSGARGGQPFPPDFTLGALPPEFQFRPPGERRPERNPGTGPRDAPGIGRSTILRQPHPAPPHGEPPHREPRPEARPGQPFDRMEFIVWRHDGSVLSRSEGFADERYSGVDLRPVVGREPRVMPGRGYIDAAMMGPFETTILVRRPLGHDLARLHGFGFQIAGIASGTLFIGIAGGRWISGRMVQPIELISVTAAQVSAANLDRRIDASRLDQELVQLASVLNSTFERLESSFSRLTQFTADASHELRTPLAVIQSQIELALSHPRSAESYQQTLATCHRSSERMRTLIDGLLMLARTDAGQTKQRLEVVDLRCVVEEAIVQCQDQAVSSGIDLEFAAPDGVIGVHANTQFLIQVPVNLIDNAIQHTSPGGSVKVEIQIVDATAVLSVRDTGCGIAAQHLPHLFERFYRVDTARSRSRGGCGLGLSICRSLVESFGGNISCESHVGAGSVFFVHLPLAGNSTTSESVQKFVT
ncbi:MAG: hypothetical protein KDB01_26610 [Planctomycetaceae bacterium]|nr:hypothetical protein [Planctomycetaceae bacterium]